MKKNPLKKLTEDWEIARAKELVECILTNRIFVVANSKNNHAQILQKNEKYISQFTVVLMRWGYFRKAANSDFNCRLNTYCPNQDISASLACFMHDAKDAGLYDGEKEFNGGESYETIWI